MNEQLAEIERTQKKWEQEQIELLKKLDTNTGEWYRKPDGIKFVGGADISFIKGDDNKACAAFVIISYPDMKPVYEKYAMIDLTAPYIPGFLAFREVPAISTLIEEVRRTRPEIFPQVILVDGNGVLHPRGFGVACHLGVVCNVPAIGVAKTLLLVDGLTKKNVRFQFKEKCKKEGEYMELIGDSGRKWGLAYKTSDESSQPLFISQGHGVTLDDALEIVRKCRIHKMPEPIRLADINSRDYLRKLGYNQN